MSKCLHTINNNLIIEQSMLLTQAIREEEGEWFAMYIEYVHKAAQLEMFQK